MADELILRWTEVASEEMQHSRREVIRAMESLMHDLHRELRRIDNGGLPDVLGVVQGQGSNVDRLCALYTERAEKHRKMLELKL